MRRIGWKLDMFVALGIGRLEGGFGLTPQAHGNPGVLHFENSSLLFRCSRTWAMAPRASQYRYMMAVDGGRQPHWRGSAFVEEL